MRDPAARRWVLGAPRSSPRPCCRHKRNREAAQELLGRLRDNWELQRFLQDGQEVSTGWGGTG